MKPQTIFSPSLSFHTFMYLCLCKAICLFNSQIIIRSKTKRQQIKLMKYFRSITELVGANIVGFLSFFLYLANDNATRNHWHHLKKYSMIYESNLTKSISQ